jgi:hypothetical protein
MYIRFGTVAQMHGIGKELLTYNTVIPWRLYDILPMPIQRYAPYKDDVDSPRE